MKPNPNSYRSLETEVIRWAEARKIIPRSTPVAQSRKTLEETGELMEAAAAMKVCADLLKMHPELEKSPQFYEYREAIAHNFKDAVGDVMVTLINACALADVDLVSCLAHAYDEIKDRKGTLSPDGVFIKESA